MDMLDNDELVKTLDAVTENNAVLRDENERLACKIMGLELHNKRMVEAMKEMSEVLGKGYQYLAMQKAIEIIEKVTSE